jgi:hypothetical protein
MTQDKLAHDLRDLDQRLQRIATEMEQTTQRLTAILHLSPRVGIGDEGIE